jgi:hypothetical protein
VIKKRNAISKPLGCKNKDAENEEKYLPIFTFSIIRNLNITNNRIMSPKLKYKYL